MDNLAGISIPDSSLEALGALVNITDTVMGELLSALREIPVSLNRETIQKIISARVRSASREDLDKLTRVVLTTNATRGHFEAPIPEFVDDVVSAMLRSERPELFIVGDTEKKFRANLTQLLSFESLSTASKAMHLKDDHERVFYLGRILTDARPVYGADTKEAPSAIVISHTLKLSFSKDDGFGDFYIVLDRDDLEFLQDLLERAKQKEDSLKNVFKAAQIPVVEP